MNSSRHGTMLAACLTPLFPCACGVSGNRGGDTGTRRGMAWFPRFDARYFGKETWRTMISVSPHRTRTGQQPT